MSAERSNFQRRFTERFTQGALDEVKGLLVNVLDRDLFQRYQERLPTTYRRGKTMGLSPETYYGIEEWAVRAVRDEAARTRYAQGLEPALPLAKFGLHAADRHLIGVNLAYADSSSTAELDLLLNASRHEVLAVGELSRITGQASDYLTADDGKLFRFARGQIDRQQDRAEQLFGKDGINEILYTSNRDENARKPAVPTSE